MNILGFREGQKSQLFLVMARVRRSRNTRPEAEREGCRQEGN